MGFVSTAARMLLGLSPFSAATVLVSPRALSAPLALSRAQTGAVVSTAQIDLQYAVLAPRSLVAPLTLARAQAGGAVATGDT